MPLTRRRVLLASAGLLTSPLVAGCARPQLGEPTTTTSRGPTQGRAEPLRIEETVTADKYEYIASNDTVRYPAAKAGGEVVKHGYTAFDRWVTVEGLSRGAQAVFDLLSSRLNGKTTGLAAGVGTMNEDLGVFVSYRTHLDRDGDVVSEPSVTFEQVVDATPQRVVVTLHLSGHTGRASSPVMVRRSTMRNQ